MWSGTAHDPRGRSGSLSLHSTLPAFFRDARRTARPAPARRGELREPSREKAGYLWLIPNCVSARVRMKQANDACQVLLEKWANRSRLWPTCTARASGAAFGRRVAARAPEPRPRLDLRLLH